MGRLIKKKGELSQINYIRNVKKDIQLQQKVMISKDNQKYYKQLYGGKIESRKGQITVKIITHQIYSGRNRNLKSVIAIN